MDNGSLKRKNLKFSDIDLLSQELDNNYNRFINAELGFWYSMDTTLKSYAKLPSTYKIHALLEHGVMLTEYTEGSFRAHECLPSIVSSKYRVNILKKEKNFNGAYAIGPYVHYARLLLNNEQMEKEKERLGETLLVFPSHSIDGYVSEFDYENFCNNIKKYAENYDSVRICLYYKDIQLNRHEIYQKNGFEVVTAGHPNDNYFLPRLKTIIELSDMTMSNNLGTHLGYCIYLNKPHYLDLNNDSKHIAKGIDKNSEILMEAKKSLNLMNQSDNVKTIKELFSNFDEKINKEQYKIISYLWGFDEVKSPNELKELLQKINNNFSWIKYFITVLKTKL